MSSEDQQAIAEAVREIADVIGAKRQTDKVPWPDLVLREIRTDAAHMLDAERVAIANGAPAELPAADVELTHVARDRVIAQLKQPG